MSDFDGLVETHLHRATRATSLEWLRGRDALIAADLADFVERGGRPAKLITATGAMTALRLYGALGEWSRHVWFWYEGAWVIAEMVIEDSGARLAALDIDSIGETARLAATHRLTEPFGELHAGTGQLAAGSEAILPPDFPLAARDMADALHRMWNGAEFTAPMMLWHPEVRWSGPEGATGDRAALRDWIMSWRVRFDDAVILFEAAAVCGDRIALLWRLHGTTHGRRIRLHGSSLMTVAEGLIVADETLLDVIAARVQGMR